MIDRAVASGGKISFNMLGITKVDEILAGLDTGTGWTSLELRYVCKNPEIRAVTTFYNVTGNPPCWRAGRTMRPN
jgi:hypothetical protein